MGRFILASFFSFRYILDPKKKPRVKIQPPFIRPDLSDRQITIKISDNGIHSTIIRSKVSRAVPVNVSKLTLKAPASNAPTWYHELICCFLPSW